MVFGAKEVVNDNKLNEMGFWNEGRRGLILIVVSPLQVSRW